MPRPSLPKLNLKSPSPHLGSEIKRNIQVSRKVDRQILEQIKSKGHYPSNFIAKNIQKLKFIGQGNDAKVFKALYAPNASPIALKQIYIQKEQQKRIREEIICFLMCSHPNIVRCFGVLIEKSQVSIGLEFLNKGSLRNHIRRDTPQEFVVAYVAFEILKGLSYLEKRKIIHRDLKPENILFNDLFEVKISDFGVSGIVKTAENVKGTFTGSLVYMSPERFDKEYQYNSDVWSLGIMLLEWTNGGIPFKNENLNPLEFRNFLVSNNLVEFVPESFGEVFRSFLGECFELDAEKRKNARELLKHPFVKKNRGLNKKQRGMLREWLENSWQLSKLEGYAN